jgi:hypothetical protein
MNRFLIFTVLFPLGALLIFVGPHVYKDGQLPPFESIPVMLGIAYFIGCVPAWLSALVDWQLAKFPFYVQLVGTMAAATVLAVIVGRYFGVDPHDAHELVVGLMGAIPAASCSLLANYNEKRGARAVFLY